MEVHRDRRRLSPRRGHVLRELRWNLTTLNAFWATDFRFDKARNDKRFMTLTHADRFGARLGFALHHYDPPESTGTLIS